LEAMETAEREASAALQTYVENNDKVREAVLLPMVAVMLRDSVCACVCVQ
jgi:hypothetical protein